MSLRSFEAMMLREAREVTKKRSLRQKDIAEWSTSEGKVKRDARPDEKVFHLPETGVWIAVLGVK